MHYCHYILSKCCNGWKSAAAPERYTSIESVLSEYENSSCFIKRDYESNFFLWRDLKDLLCNVNNFNFLTRYNDQAKSIWNKCKRQIKKIDGNNIDDAESLMKLFSICADTLWLLADGYKTENMPTREGRQLSKTIVHEIRNNVKYCIFLNDLIEKEKKELEIIELVDESSFPEQLLISAIGGIADGLSSSRVLGGVSQITAHPIFDYTLNYTQTQRKEIIENHKESIRFIQTIYYAFIATNILNNYLRGR